MVINKKIAGQNCMIIVLALCLAISVSACSPDDSASTPPPEITGTVPVETDGVEIANAETVEMYDLSFSISSELEWYEFSGAEQSVYISFETDDNGSSKSWMSISPRRPSIENEAVFEPTTADPAGMPILTAESVTNIFDWETEVLSIYDEGALTVGGTPGAYLEVELLDGDQTWRIRLTRTICKGIAYDFLYASLQDSFGANLPAAESIIATAKLESGDPTEEYVFGDLAISCSTNGVTASVSEDELYLFNNRNQGSALRFYIKRDDTVLYTDELLEDTAQVDRLLRIWSYNLVDQRFRQFHEPLEILREETDINGSRALRAVYHDVWEHNQFDEYFEVILLVHNFDLYVLQGKVELGYEDVLDTFTQPIIESIRFEKTVSAPPTERPMPYTDTVKWITDTFKILTVRNAMDTDLVGGYLPTEENAEGMRDGLYRNWGISDRESSDEVISSLYQNGHRVQFLEFVDDCSPIYELDDEEYLSEMIGLPEEYQDLRYIFDNTRDAYRQHGVNALLAWDYCRIIYLYCSGYIAGYYTYSEALDKSLPIALELQGAYTSWGEMYRDYMAGFHFWSPGDVNDTNTENYTRTQIMLALESEKHEAGSLPWDTILLADWHGSSD